MEKAFNCTEKERIGEGKQEKGTKAEERGGRSQWLHPVDEFFYILHHVNIIRL